MEFQSLLMEQRRDIKSKYSKDGDVKNCKSLTLNCLNIGNETIYKPS